MRLGTATAMAVVGIEGRPVRIEAVLLRGLPAVTIVGLPAAYLSGIATHTRTIKSVPTMYAITR